MSRGFAIALALACLTALPAAAQEKDPDKLIKKGVELRKKRRDADALAAFREAYAIKATPRTLAQIALAEQALGAWLDSAQHLEEALGEATDPWIRSNQKVLRDSLAAVEGKLSRLVFTGLPENALIRAGNSMSMSPKPVRVLCGSEISIEANAEGYLPREKKIIPACGKEEIVELALEKIPAPEPKREAPPSVVVAPVQREEPSSLKPYAWVTAGGAVLGLGTGTAFLFVRESHAKKYNDDERCLPANGTTREENCSGDRKSAERAQLFSIIGFGAGGALAVASAVLFVLDGGGDSSGEPRLSCGPSIEGGGLFCAGVFE